MPKLNEIKNLLPEKKEEIETCSKCGGLGRNPNHPHILATTCKRCNGTSKIVREDYKICNQYHDQIAESQVGLSRDTIKWILYKFFPKSYMDDGEFQLVNNNGMHLMIDGNEILDALEAEESKIIVKKEK